MVTDTYAHGFDADRKLIAHEMDSKFFSKVGAEPDKPLINTKLMEQLKALIKQHPEMLAELLSGDNGDEKGAVDST